MRLREKVINIGVTTLTILTMSISMFVLLWLYTNGGTSLSGGIIAFILLGINGFIFSF
ncbi:hypothetical protein [Lactococcus petauri]|uniref:hypothetical protein n=1 Tax=Lactococcus petauri TaxID=1940789 RepID=UPI002550967F|nr:hypothetical protein [Lactococcus petauri]